jgi:hypothetical protein
MPRTGSRVAVPETPKPSRVLLNKAALALMSVALSSTALAETSLKTDIVPLLNERCVMCHITGAALAGLELYTDAWAALVNVTATQAAMPLVAPGEPDRSYFYLKLTDAYLAAGGSGEKMPIQQEAFNAEQLALIRSWIEQGAPNN